METKIFNSKFERLRNPERLAKMEVPRVVELSLAGLNDVKRVLDVGTGSAVFAEEFLKFVPEVSGVDLNPVALELARKLVPQANYELGKMEHLPYADDDFDIVFMGLVLHETPEREQTLVEAMRCARKRVVVFEWPSFEKDDSVDTGKRVAVEEIQKYADDLGFANFQQIELTHMMLYILDI